MKLVELSVGFLRRLPGQPPSPVWGHWALLRMLENRDAGDSGSDALPASAMVHPTSRAYLQYAAAMRFGRAGRKTEAAAAVAMGDRLIGTAPWYFHIARRLVAEAALEDGWGEPARWLSEAEAFFSQHGYPRVVSACRALLRRCGVRPSVSRARTSVPEPFLAAGVTEREMEVLAVVSDGLSNKEIAARLFLSPKTVEKHVASLMDKLHVRSHTQLAAMAAARMGDTARTYWGKSRM